MAGLVVPVAAAGSLVLAPTGAAAHEGGDGDLKEVRMFDDCEQVSFNRMFGAGTCVGDGETILDEFISQLLATAPSGVPNVDGWEFEPSDVRLDADKGLRAVNRGGEFHTFTKVKAFGGGCVDEAPVLSGPQKPVPECKDKDVFELTGAPPGHDVVVRGLKAGTHRFECLIHPWMRTTVVVRAHH